MTVPIRERGIRWQESYSGDKSAYLKEQMEAQIGPGSYYRWEGHDNTTGNDYYVVVSPGFSKKKGYYFFAGLRKMPADQGASGKKFKAQAEAMAYARKTWRVPAPATKPVQAGGYKEPDIAGKEVILELQHKTASTNPFMTKKAMSFQYSGGTQANYEPYMGEQVFTDVLCKAYQSAPITGFLPGMMARQRLLGTDVINQTESQWGRNEITGDTHVKMPMAAQRATYQAPPAPVFEQRINKVGVTVQNDLLQVRRNKSGAVESVSYKPQYDPTGATPGYETATWRTYRLRPTVVFSPQAFLQSEALWRTLAAKVKLPGALAQADVKKYYEGIAKRTFTDRVSVPLDINPESYSEFENTVKLYKGIISIQKQGEQDLIDVLKYHERTKEPFNWDQPIFEGIKTVGSQLVAFDESTLLPLGVPFNREERTGAETKKGIGSSGKYVFNKERDPNNPNAMGLQDIIGSYASKTLDRIGQMAEIRDFIQYEDIISNMPEGMKKNRAIEKQRQKQELISVYANTLGIKTKTGELVQFNLDRPDDRAKLFKVVSKSLPQYIAAISSPDWKPNEESKADFSSKFGEYYSRYKSYDVEGMKKAHDNIRPSLSGFRELCSNGLVKLTSEMFKDSRTLPPRLFDLQHSTPDVDKYLFPKQDMQLGGMGRVSRSYAPDFTVSANTETAYDDPEAQKLARLKASGQPLTPEQENRLASSPQRPVHAARYYDVNEERYCYGPIPEGFNPTQGTQTGLKGLNVIIPSGTVKSRMLRPDGSIHEVDLGEWPDYETAAGQDGARFVTGDCNVLVVSPESSNSSQSDRELKAQGITSAGFSLLKQHHCVEINGGIPSLRQHNSELFTGKRPEGKENKDYYTIKDPTDESKSIDLTPHMFSQGNKIFFDNTDALKLFVKDKLGIPLTMTSLTSEDLRIIDDYSSDGKRYYQACKAYEEAVALGDQDFLAMLGNPANKTQYITANPADKDKVELAALGMQYKASFNQEKYEYGKNCFACSNIKSFDSEQGKRVMGPIWDKYKQALADPEADMAPKTGVTVFAIMYDENGQKTYVEDKTGYAMVFGSRTAAEQALQVQKILNEESDIKKENLRLVKYPAKALPLSVHRRGGGDHVPEKEAIMKHLNEGLLKVDNAFKEIKTWTDPEMVEVIKEQLKNIITGDENQLARLQREFPGFTQEDCAKLYQKLEGLSGPALAPEPTLAPEPAAAQPAPVMPAPAQPAAIALPAAAPAMPVNFDAESKRLTTELDLAVRNKDLAKKQEITRQLKELRQRQQPVQASSAIQRLVVLANKLDDQGRFSEAEAIDRMLKGLCRGPSE